jgi:hypothetical protein
MYLYIGCREHVADSDRAVLIPADFLFADFPLQYKRYVLVNRQFLAEKHRPRNFD